MCKSQKTPVIHCPMCNEFMPYDPVFETEKTFVCPSCGFSIIARIVKAKEK